jgi:diaminopimelate epimerase
MPMLQFTKMNGAGNDFVMVDNRDGALSLSGAQIARLCDRHRGAGADGLLAVEKAEGGADFRMRYYNADGAEAEMCGNGARCFARFVQRIAPVTGGTVSFETPAGLIRATLTGELVSLGMSEPGPFAEGVELEAAGDRLTVYAINTGVPHAVVLVDDLDGADVRGLGAALRHHQHFQPRGTNVNFVRQLGPQDLAIRTYERGVEDETLACGTGVVASALTIAALTGAASPVRVLVKGGDTLTVSFDGGAGGFRNVVLTGPADFVFEGEIPV